MVADRGLRIRLARLAKTVRFRVTAYAVLAVFVVLVVTGVILVGSQRRTLTSNIDEGLAQGAASIESALAAGVPTVLGGFGDDDAVAQVVSPEGRVLASTTNVAGQGPIADLPRGRDRVLYTASDLPHDQAEFRLLARRVDTAQGPMVIMVASTLGDVEESTDALATSLTVTIPAVAALLGVLVWWLVGRTLLPVETIRAAVASIGGADLHRRVPEPGTGDEVDRLAVTMNSMLDRTEDAATRQQRFVADASHELRSPLTRIRAELEVDLSAAEQADLLATHRSVLEETISLQGLVEDLLHLARSDSGSVTARRQPVDLDDIVLAHARGLWAEGRLDVDTTGVSAARVQGDPRQLHRAVGNLAENARRYAASKVTFSTVARDGVAVVTVSDDGPGIPEAARELVFDRFTRLDNARGTASGGVGLGLAITRDIVERHGGSVVVDPRHHPGTRIVLTLPAPALPDPPSLSD
jgi:signal transduction histidine kinase